MSLDHIILSLMVLIELVVSVYFIVRNATDARERMAALMQGQAHSAELVADVLRRTPAP